MIIHYLQIKHFMLFFITMQNKEKDEKINEQLQFLKT